MITADSFKKYVSSLQIGKKLPDAIYLHSDCLEHLPDELTQFINAVANALKISPDQWNLVKLAKNEFRLSLLHYPDFFTDSYPALSQSVTVNLAKVEHRITSYQNSENPPILHRKETMLPPDHHAVEQFKLLTAEGEAAGLYENPRMIGFKQSWERIIQQKGYELVDGHLFRNSAVITEQSTSDIDRHKTAIVRYELSTPMKQLAKHGYLNGEYSIFDYGCGRGDDLRELEAHGLSALGWDPNFLPEAEKINSDLVNIGFVINVIEDQIERSEAIIEAWHLTNKLLVISAMLGNESHTSQFTPYKDGVITSRNTFQKYFNQSELKGYIERTIDENAIAVAPGVFYIFKDKLEEQRYLAERQKRFHKWDHLSVPAPTSEENARLLVAKHQALFDRFWDRCLDLGRIPSIDEFDEIDDLKNVCGSPKKAFRLIESIYDINDFKLAEKYRKEDLLVYLALAQFDKNKTYVSTPEEQKRDINVFFDSYKIASFEATELLYSIANAELIEILCNEAHKALPASVLNKGHSLLFHKQFLVLLPPLLRVYVGAAAQLYGEIDNIQLIKIHITSGKVSLMKYDGFDDTPLPKLVERIKIKMAEQDVDFFDYVDDYRQPPLLFKSVYLDESALDYKKQVTFDNRLRKILNTNNTEVFISQGELQQKLNSENVEIRGYRFYKTGILPKNGETDVIS